LTLGVVRSFPIPLIALTFGALANFQKHLKNVFPFDPELRNELATDTCDEISFDSVLKALAASTPNCHTRDDPRP
jgi:hypothetical protein